MFGKWPQPSFALLDEEAKVAFWRAGDSGAKGALKKLVTDHVIQKMFTLADNKGKG